MMFKQSGFCEDNELGKRIALRASKMVLAAARQVEFDAWNPCGGTRALTPRSCPLGSPSMLCGLHLHVLGHAKSEWL